MDLSALTQGLAHSPTPICGLGQTKEHLSIDTACLEVSNIDPTLDLEFWAQAKECYTCPPWKYLSLAANTSHSMIVNSTYPTDVYIRNTTGSDIHRLLYHFGQFGSFHLKVDSNDISVRTLARPNLEILPVVVMIIFFTLLALMWQCSKFLTRRMDSPSHIPSATTVTERSPLLVSTTTNVASGSSSSTNVASGSSSSTDVGSASTNKRGSWSDSQAGPSFQPNAHSSTSSENTASAPLQIIHVLEQVPDSRRSGGRLSSLDVFRGTAIVIMIFVNYGGGKYHYFKHARWNGLTVADLVFPWFLWIMGVSLTFSIRSQLRRATKRYLIMLKILKRCIMLFLFGVIINSDGHNYMPTFRILGVLQRFAFCYLVTAAIEVYCMAPQQNPEYVWYWKFRDLVRSWLQWLITLVLVIIHIIVTFGLPVPGCPTGYLGPGGLHMGGAHSNCTGGAAGYVDQMLLGKAHMYGHPTCAPIYDSHTPYDPEGFLGILTSILMVQFGVAAGRIIVTHDHHISRIIRWLIWGTVCGLLAGFFCGWRKEGGLIPINKNLWSLSFVLTTASFAFYLLSFLYFVIDQLRWWKGNPIRYVGMNAIVLYMGHEILGKLFPWSWSPVGSYHLNYLIMNVWGTCLWVATSYVLHLKKVYISV